MTATETATAAKSSAAPTTAKTIKQPKPLPAPNSDFYDLAETLPAEEKEVLPMVEDKMKTAIELNVPIVVEMGTGETWLEAH